MPSIAGAAPYLAMLLATGLLASAGRGLLVAVAVGETNYESERCCFRIFCRCFFLIFQGIRVVRSFNRVLHTQLIHYGGTAGKLFSTLAGRVGLLCFFSLETFAHRDTLLTLYCAFTVPEKVAIHSRTGKDAPGISCFRSETRNGLLNSHCRLLGTDGPAGDR